MGEIKIILSEKTEKLVSKIVESLGIKKSEYVKSLVIENLKELKLKEDKK
ncbi:MAG: hypothetical protein KC516_03635 [Nanoarchaeota archaeon]|nr:hypothetical protein [Nanoarchaeota archaeon]